MSAPSAPSAPSTRSTRLTRSSTTASGRKRDAPHTAGPGTDVKRQKTVANGTRATTQASQNLGSSSTTSQPTTTVTIAVDDLSQVLSSLSNASRAIAGLMPAHAANDSHSQATGISSAPTPLDNNNGSASAPSASTSGALGLTHPLPKPSTVKEHHGWLMDMLSDDGLSLPVPSKGNLVTFVKPGRAPYRAACLLGLKDPSVNGVSIPIPEEFLAEKAYLRGRDLQFKLHFVNPNAPPFFLYLPENVLISVDCPTGLHYFTYGGTHFTAKRYWRWQLFCLFVDITFYDFSRLAA